MRKIALFIISIMLLSCDGPYDDCPEYYFSDDFKSFVCYNEGSYWVSEDTTYQQRDSVVLEFQSITFRDVCKPSTNPTEIVEHHFYSSFFSINSEIIKVRGHADSGGEYNQSHLPPTGYFKDHQSTGLPYTPLDSVQINEHWYHDIRIYNSGDNEYYWAKNIGLIRKVIRHPWDSDTIYHFDLLRYHLE